MSFDDIGYLQDFPEFVENGSPLCSEVDPELFFPVDRLDSTLSHRESYENEQGAKQVCEACPYKLECLAFALNRPDIQGIWGGTTQWDRRRITRKMNARLRSDTL
jgi:WhiB family redox-sensing transcriptional regulator